MSTILDKIVEDKEKEVERKLDKMAMEIKNLGHPWEGKTHVYKKDNNFYIYLRYVMYSKDPIITKYREEYFKFLSDEESYSFLPIIDREKNKFSSNEKEIMLKVINAGIHTKGTPGSRFFSGLA